MISKEKIIKELAMGYQSQSDGNDGKARVCSRRAVGWAIKKTYLSIYPILGNKTAFECIKFLHDQPETDSELHKKLAYFTQKVVKDSLNEDSYFPLTDINIVKEAHQLCEKMMGEPIILSTN
jgi:hypothetical protein